MIPLLLAATLAVSTPGIQKDLTGPVQRLLDAPAAAPISKDLKGPATAPLDGKVHSFVLPAGAPLPPGALLNVSPLQRDAGALCHKQVTETPGPASAQDPLAPKYVTPEARKKLGDLPPGLVEHAVNRLVNGCPVREIAWGGQTYYLDMPVAKLERTDPVVFHRVQH